MDNAFRSLSDEEVRQIGLIIETLNQSAFDFLQLEFGDVKLTIGKGQPPPTVGGAPGVSAAAPAAVPQAPAAATITAAPVSPPSQKAAKGEAAAPDGTVAIVATLLGRFYAQPEPGAAPFVSVGSKVTADTTVGLVEVMKTFNAVPAGVSGVVTEISVQDAELVEYGQALFRIRPAA